MYTLANSVISITPTKIEYGAANETGYCDKLKYNIYRSKPKSCLNYHAEETEIKLCGRAPIAVSCLSPLLLIVCVLLRYIFLGPSVSVVSSISSPNIGNSRGGRRNNMNLIQSFL